MSDERVSLRLDGRIVEVPRGATILDAAKAIDLEIPTLCHVEGMPPRTSCMACLVMVEGESRLLPACATEVRDGMDVKSEVPEVLDARRTAIELLLSEHGGDCLGPCHLLCPAWLDAPRMIEEILRDDLAAAIRTVKYAMALPATLGRICSAPCEKGCRRSGVDGAVGICRLKRFVADHDLASDKPYVPLLAPDSGRRAAVIGAGPAGLSAAYHLRRAGIGVSLFDEAERPGGALRHEIPEDRLPREVLDGEIGILEAMGVTFRPGQRLGRDLDLAEARRNFDGVILALGTIDPKGRNGQGPGLKGIALGERGVIADRYTFATGLPGVFAAGGVIRPERMAVRALAQGKKAAHALAAYLETGEAEALHRPFTTRLGRLDEGELTRLAAGREEAAPVTPGGGAEAGFTGEEARREAVRCLRCDCARVDDCKLRHWAEVLDARAGRYDGPRRRYERIDLGSGVILEPSKCISCGICVDLSAKARPGFAFSGRGFGVTVRVPEGLVPERMPADLLEVCVAACPTGALRK